MKKIFLYFSFLYFCLLLCPIVSDLAMGNEAFIEINSIYAQNIKNKSKSNEQKSDQTDKNKKTDKELAETLVPEYKAAEPEEVSYTWPIIKALFVIGLFIFAFYIFFKFISKKVGLPTFGKDIIQVLAITPIGPGKFIQIVNIAGKILVLGITENNINLISEVTEKDEIDRIKLLSSKSISQNRTEPHQFQDFIKEQLGAFSDFLKKGNNNNLKNKKHKSNFDFAGNHDDDSSRIDYLKKQKDRLKKINGSDDE